MLIPFNMRSIRLRHFIQAESYAN